MSALLTALPPEDANVHLLAMLTPSSAVDLYLGDCQRRGLSRRTIERYRSTLDHYSDSLPAHYDVTDIRPDDARRFLDRFNNPKYAQGYRCVEHSALSQFHRWLYSQDRVRVNVMDKIARPRRIPSDELDVTTVSTDEVFRLQEAAETWPERLAIGVLIYMGPRRRAVATLRLRDYDREQGMLRFKEKGGKTIWKPVPDELAELLDLAIADGVLVDPNDYLIPSEGPLSRPGDRDDRVIWRLVKRIAGRAGVETHVHALRAAFAVFYLEQPGADIQALKDLMGHRSSTTTEVYLRRLDRQARMETVRTLSWKRPDMGAVGFGPTQHEAPGLQPGPALQLRRTPADDAVISGSSQIASETFVSSSHDPLVVTEPPYGDSRLSERAGSERTESSIEEPLNQAVSEVASREREPA